MLSATVRARAAIAGKMARQAASKAVSHTIGLVKAFSKTPDDKKEKKRKKKISLKKPDLFTVRYGASERTIYNRSKTLSVLGQLF